MATVVGKRRHDGASNTNTAADTEDWFVDAPPDSASDQDSTDSDESEYSGIGEDEEDSSEEEAVQSIEEGSESDDDDDDDDDDDESDDDEEEEEEEGEKDEAVTSGITNTQIKNAVNNKKTQKKSRMRPSKKTTESGGNNNTEPGPSTNQGDEYDYDSSDEEDIRNTVGNIPMQWYNEYAHIGYTVEGKKIIKPKKADELDEFINKMDNPDYWKTVKDRSTGQDVVLSADDVQMIQRMQKGKYADGDYNPYEPWVDFNTYEPMIHPVKNTPPHKRTFIPSRLESMKVSRMVHAIKMGWIKPRKPKQEEDDEPQFFDIWKDDDLSEINKRFRLHIPAPKMRLPGHAESYNPPPEYLLTEEEELAWREQDPEVRKLNFIPQKYSSLRAVPGYSRFMQDRFERCLDLYLCPRQRKMRMNVNPEDLIPTLPKPKDLQPFPTTQSIVYRGHTGLIRCISIDPSGEWMASGSDDGSIRLWEVATGRCMKVLEVGGTVKGIEWNPNPALCLIAAAVSETVYIINPQLGDKVVVAATDNMISSFKTTEDTSTTGNKTGASWHTVEGKEYEDGFRIKVTHIKEVSDVTWQAKGDYFATVMPQGDSRSVTIHQMSKRRSQNPFKKNKGLVQTVKFHPTRPFLFVATQRNVRIYNLLKQELSKKLMTNCKWVSSIAVHPKGDNVIVGSYDSKMSWFDMDLSTKPYQTLRHHKQAVRGVSYHKKYPLFASSSDDGTVIVCHGMVYNDLLQNPLIVPVKILRGHEKKKDLGVLACEFHPTQPWIFSSGSDATIRLYT